MTGAEFLEAELGSVVFDGCDLSGADLRGATLQRCELRRCTLEESGRGAAARRGHGVAADRRDAGCGPRRWGSRCWRRGDLRRSRADTGRAKAPVHSVDGSSPPPGEQAPAPQPEDPWDSARRRVHDDVAAALAQTERSCPSCGRVQTGRGRLCEQCGADMVARRPRRRLSRGAIAAIVLALAAATAGAVLVTKPTRRDARAEAARQRAQQAASEAAEVRRLRIDVRPVRAAGPPRRAGEDALTHRRELVLAAERLVTRDARARVRAGTLRGPVAGTQCLPYPATTARRDAEADPAVTAGRYECVAYRNTFEAPEVEGSAAPASSAPPSGS